MRAIFRMLKKREYKGKDGSQKVAHNLEITVPERGTGDLYVTEDAYLGIKSLGLSDGDEVELTFDLDAFRGQISPRLAGVSPVAAG